MHQITQITIEGIPVTITGTVTPVGHKVVRVDAEIYGPNNPEEYGISVEDIESFAVFRSVDGSPIGFALIEAAKATGKRIQHVSIAKPIEQVDVFDMPVRFVNGIKTAVKSLHSKGYKIFISADLIELLRNNHALNMKVEQIPEKVRQEKKDEKSNS